MPYENRQVRQPGGANLDRLYAVGWARRGPTGTIGTNRPDGYEIADQVAAAMPADSATEREGAAGLKRLLESRGTMPTIMTTGERSRRPKSRTRALELRARNSFGIPTGFGALDR